MNNSEFFVSYETELINNGIFFTDSNGLELMRRQFMERDFDYNSDTVSLSTNLYPITAIAMIKDQFNGLEVGVVVDRPNFVTSHHEG